MRHIGVCGQTSSCIFWLETDSGLPQLAGDSYHQAGLYAEIKAEYSENNEISNIVMTGLVSLKDQQLL